MASVAVDSSTPSETLYTVSVMPMQAKNRLVRSSLSSSSSQPGSPLPKMEVNSDIESESLVHSFIDGRLSVSSRDSFTDLYNSGDELERTDLSHESLKRLMEPSLSREKKRRKQSNPIRLALARGANSDVHFRGKKFDSISKERKNYKIRFSRCSISERAEDGHRKVSSDYANSLIKTEQEFSDGEEYPLDLSNAREFSNFWEDSQHYSFSESPSKHSNNNFEISKNMVNAFEQDESDVEKQNSILTHGTYANSHPFLLPIIQSGSSLFNSSQGNCLFSPVNGAMNHMRIFNLEAYCEICNKEFCNKYFLKTHKANKHGIYHSEKGEGHFTSPTPPLSATMIANSTRYSWSKILPASDAKTEENFMAANLSLLPRTTSPNRIIQFSPKAVPPIMKYPSKYSPTIKDEINQKSVSSGNIESFCDVCQRVFCNKYFLKRHKAKLHGIIEEGIEGFMCRIPKVKNRDTLQTSESGSKKNAEDLLSCTFCQEQVERLEDYESHLKNTHAFLSESTISMIVQSYIESCKKSSSLADNQISDKMENMKESCISQKSMDFEETKLFSETISVESSHHGKDLSAPSNSLINFPDEIKKDEKESSNGYDGKDMRCEYCGRPFVSAYLLQVHKQCLHSSHGNAESNDPDLENESEMKADVKGEKEESSNNDLHKLQSMILELNSDTEHDKKIDMSAHINRNMLQAQESRSDEQSGSQRVAYPSFHPSSSFTELTIRNHLSCLHPDSAQCYACKKIFYDKLSLQQHLQTIHGRTMLSSSSFSFYERMKRELERFGSDCKKSFETKSSSSTSRSYCEICNKELCNKYFMKTHMLKMHGINLENGSMLGGVTCDICNKELCSKYFLKVHKQNTHGILDDSVKDTFPNNLYVDSDPSGLTSEPGELHGSKNLNHFTETCSFCNKKFKSVKWVKVHLMNDHGEAGIRHWEELEKVLISGKSSHKDSTSSYQCKFCNCVCLDSMSLQIHVMEVHPCNEIKESRNDNESNMIENSEIHHNDNDETKMSFSRMHSEDISSPKEVQETERNGINLMTEDLKMKSEMTYFQSSEIIECPLCFLKYRDMLDFQRHVVSEHSRQYEINESDCDWKSSTDQNVHCGKEEYRNNLLVKKMKRFKRFRCPRCYKKFKTRENCLMHFHSVHGYYRKKVGSCNYPQKYKRCKCVCNHVSNFGRCVVKNNILRKITPNGFRAHVPPSYGIPQMTKLEDTFIMQPFLMKTASEDKTSNNAEFHAYFIPSTVYLPVRYKVSQPLTVTFQLTPAK